MIFVTGGTGLIGSHLLVELTAQSVAITAIYRSSEKIQVVKQVFLHYLGADAESRFSKINWQQCDILDVPRLESLMQNHKEVYHCAAIVSFSRRDFQRMIQVNRVGTANLVNLSLELGIEKFCLVSSTAAIGEKNIRDGEEITEDAKYEISDETSGYSISKYKAETEVWRGIEEGLNAVIVNPSVVIGAGDWNESSLVIFRTIKKGLRFYSPGSNAFVDARDVAKIMVMLMQKPIFSERFLVIGENMPFRSLFNLIALELNQAAPKFAVSKWLMGAAWRVSALWAALTFSSPVVTKSSARSAFRNKRYSNEKIKQALGVQFTSVQEAVENAVAFHRSFSK
jgi:nucleoside-diphosphate-sugar epimerase